MRIGPLLLAALTTLSVASARAADEQWQIGTASSFSSGRFGTDVRTEILHTPITARRLFESGDLTLVFPVTCIRGIGEVTVLGGSPVRVSGGAPSRPATGGGRPGDGSSAEGAAADTTAARSPTLTHPATACGPGDIVVRGRYYLVDERGWIPTIALRAHVKAPTASAARGLGTGRPDEGIGFEITRTIGGGVLAMVDGGYTVIGKPDGLALQNVWWYDVGIGRIVANGAADISVFFEEYRALVPGLANARDLLAAVTIRRPSGWRVQVAGLFGLSEGAPDLGLTLGVNRRF